MIKKIFQDWTYEDIETIFNIRQIKKDVLAQEWLNADYEFSETQLTELAELAELLLDSVNGWNEDELRFYFINPLLHFAQYEKKRYKLFLRRQFSTFFEKQNYVVSGYIDFACAKGKLNPKQSFFFIHEDEPENGALNKRKNRDNDPLGQVLIAMVVAKHQNERSFPLYGCYVSGRNWFFVVLHNDTYSVSRAYDATNIIELQQILASLIDIKRIIEPFL